MNRRLFLQGIALASLVAAGGMLPKPAYGELPANSLAGPAPGVRDLAAPPRTILGRLLRGTADGKVLESLDGGATWQRIANFGELCSVARLSEQNSEIHARVFLQGNIFTLHSADGRVWRTADAVRRPA